ncbi:MAG: hypothetical protein RLZZ367_456 [Bacteroidota bacterium]|jgi:hypothetical protein
MRTLLCVLVLLSIGPQLFAQTGWGKVAPAQFKQRYCPIDSAANAMVLFSKGTIEFKGDYGEFYVYYRKQYRIQILNKQGFDEANKSIVYYSRGNVEAVFDFKAQTLNADDKGNIVATKLDGKLITEEKLDDRFTVRKFVFPDIKEGSIIEYDYTIRSQNYRFIDDWDFQSDIPTLRSSVNMRCPEFLKFVTVAQVPMGLDEHKADEFLESYQASLLGYKNSDRVDVKCTDALYAINNVPALKAEKYITTMKDYEARISFVLSSISLPGRTKEEFSDNWSTVAKELMRSQFFGLYLNGLGEHLKIAKELTHNIASKQERAKIIYNHVSHHIKWDKKFRVLPSDNLAKSYKNGTGSSADINMILLDMLNAAGVTARPVLISTREHGSIKKVFPDLQQFNHVLVEAELDSNTICMDAIGAARPWYLPSVHSLNFIGLRIEDNVANWINIVPSKGSSSSLVSTIELDKSGGIAGKMILQANDYEAEGLRNALASKDIGECIKAETVITDGLEIASPVVENKDETEKKLRITFSVKKNAADENADIIYLNPFLAKFRNDNPFKLSKRTYPINFAYPFEETIKVSVKIPEGYVVTDAPKSMNVKLDNNAAGFVFLIAKTESNIQITSTLKISEAEYNAEYYENLKSIFAHAVEAYNSVIVLEKKK